MQPAVPPDARLARRLRALRERHWPGVKVTQQQVAEALGGDTALSLSLISSWESTRKPVLPPANRLAGYATFFASRRSVESDPARLLSERELSSEERAARGELYAELLSLRFPEEPQAVDEPPAPAARRLTLSATGDTIGGGTWFFPDQRPVVIVPGSLPKRIRDRMPFTDPQDPDYVRSYILADLDALLELHGHIRAVNPAVDVRIRRSEEMDEDDFTKHLVLLGGVDWNPVDRDITRRLDLPVRQQVRPNDEDSGYFSTLDGATFEPVLDEIDGLIEDVAHFYRGKNPYNTLRTVTLCNGMYGRGTYGAVRSLTDAKFRDRNEEYVRKAFPDSSAFSILMRVRINPNGDVVTPDWTLAEDRLHEWPTIDE
ncbi:helix-turn-helix domain-containing protein [Actinoplanes sp. CA-051413]|uniref:helix-turn-helix domain-containing protein n=1 Tax=Actinoplanes sp. CA-051413 TaxID=3239899 RepID=UPI003D970E9B